MTDFDYFLLLEHRIYKYIFPPLQIPEFSSHILKLGHFLNLLEILMCPPVEHVIKMTFLSLN